MSYQDVREYIEELNRRNLLQVIEEKVNKDTELVPLVRLQFRGLPEPQRKAFWFKNVTDTQDKEFDGSVLLGALGSSRTIYGAALNVQSTEIAKKWASVHGNHLKPNQISKDGAPIKQVINQKPEPGEGVDQFPHLISTPGFDPAPFITAGVWITRDP